MSDFFYKERLGPIFSPVINIKNEKLSPTVVSAIDNLLSPSGNMFTRAAAVKNLMSIEKLGLEETARVLSLKKTDVANKLRLLEFSQKERSAILEYGFSESGALEFLKLDKVTRLYTIEYCRKSGFDENEIKEYVDGVVARKYNQVSDFGKFLDPLADKLLTIAAMVMFCQWDRFPAWALMLVLTREFAVTGLRLVAVGKGRVIAAGWSGKIKTASTMIGLCALMAFPKEPILGWVVCGVIVVTTLYSGVEYFIRNWKCLWK